MPDFTHLHIHTQYSILDGQSDIKVLFGKVKEYGMKAVAITDHGNMFGVLHFLQSSIVFGIKPIIGCEIYVAEGSRFEKKGKEDRSGFHLILLARNLEGYKNLSKLCTHAYSKDAFYYTPRIDKELLQQHNKGLMASSACLGGEIPQAFLRHGEKKAEQILKEYLDIFGGDFYLELMDHGLSEQKEVNKMLMKLSAKYNVKLIATNDAHFVNADDAKAHDILVCLNTGKDYEDRGRMRYTGQEYIKSPKEMELLFAECPEALLNTQEIVEKTEFYDLKHDVILPSFPLPADCTDEDDFLSYLTYKGAEKYYPEITPELRERLDYELKVIKDKKFAGYFLIVSDYIAEAKKRNVSVGPGRGSAAGSAVAYCIGITGIDPLKYNLLFERFLNPERPTMPDIDVDFDDDGREDIKNYVVDKYGADNVALIVTFGTMAAKSAIRDVARVLKLPLQEADRLAKLVPIAPEMTLKKAFEEVPELKAARDGGSQLVKETLIYAEKLEGSIRHTGVHACGVIIGKDKLLEHLPLCTSKETDLLVTQYEGEQVEYVGMLKMDFLGLKTLSIIKDAIANIEARHGVKIDIESIPLDDPQTLKLFQKGDTVAIFQFESEGMRGYLKDLIPTNIEDLINMNALYRPGPMDYIPSFINRRHGKETIEYPHEWLESILKPTNGIMIFQEQIMLAAQIMAGYTLGNADVLRKAMGKKKEELMDSERAKFVEGAMNKGVDKENADSVFDVMKKFARYGFNRSHSAAYTLIAFQTAYLKAHYPAEYMAAVLTRNLSDIKKVTFFMDECRRAGIPVLGPDVNESEFKFVVNVKGEIRFGLGAVKGVGEAAVESIVNERKINGPYKNIFDLTKRINLRSCNKRCLEALAIAGAYDSFENSHRAQYLHKDSNDDLTFIDKVIKHSISITSKKSQSQHSLFCETDDMVIADPAMPTCSEWSKMDKFNKEKEVTGIYISGHPLDDYKVEIRNFCNVSINELDNLKKLRNRELVFAGIISSANQKLTKKGDPFGNIILEDYDGSIQMSFFSEDYIKFKDYLTKDFTILVKARIQVRKYPEEHLELKVHAISLLSDILKTHVKQITLTLLLNDLSDDMINNLSKSVKKNKGDCEVKFSVTDSSEKVSLLMRSRKIKVNSSGFIEAIANIPLLEYIIN